LRPTTDTTAASRGPWTAGGASARIAWLASGGGPPGAVCRDARSPLPAARRCPPAADAAPSASGPPATEAPARDAPATSHAATLARAPYQARSRTGRPHVAWSWGSTPAARQAVVVTLSTTFSPRAFSPPASNETTAATRRTMSSYPPGRSAMRIGSTYRPLPGVWSTHVPPHASHQARNSPSTSKTTTRYPESSMPVSSALA